VIIRRRNVSGAGVGFFQTDDCIKICAAQARPFIRAGHVGAAQVAAVEPGRSAFLSARAAPRMMIPRLFQGGDGELDRLGARPRQYA
jgi:hypothetical protein